jgi:fatty-acyl-CoA synthase
MSGGALQSHMERFADEGVIASWAVPDRYEFVEELPKTSVGKIDKKVLRSRYQA